VTTDLYSGLLGSARTPVSALHIQEKRRSLAAPVRYFDRAHASLRRILRRHYVPLRTMLDTGLTD
jgi:hypothetical protein